MANRYYGGYHHHEDESPPVWTRAADPPARGGYEVATRPPPSQPMIYQPNYHHPSPSNIPPHTTIVHSSIKPVPDAEIYIRIFEFMYKWRLYCSIFHFITKTAFSFLKCHKALVMAPNLKITNFATLFLQQKTCWIWEHFAKHVTAKELIISTFYFHRVGVYGWRKNALYAL